jgi:hypothetical protein
VQPYVLEARTALRALGAAPAAIAARGAAP